MREERMMILSMLEEGKISTKEACKLLETLEETDKDFFENKTNLNTNVNQDSQKNSENNISKKISNLFSNIINNTSFNGFRNCKTINCEIRKDISDIKNPIIDFCTVNGAILINTWDKNDLLIKINCNYKNNIIDENKDFYNFTKEGNKIIFRPLYKRNLGIKLDVYLPNKNYEKLNLKTSNGKIHITKTKADKFICNTSNARIVLDKSSAESINSNTSNSRIILNESSSKSINLNTSNGRIVLDKVSADSIYSTTANGRIKVSDTNVNNIKLITSNGRIVCTEMPIKNLKEINLSTSNASINIDFKDLNKAFFVDLKTHLGHIDLDIPNLLQEVNNKQRYTSRNIKAHSADYDESKEHVKIIASTSNGSINIKKGGVGNE